MERNWSYDFEPKGFRNSEDEKKVEDIRQHFVDLADYLQDTLPGGRYSALVKTKLEEAAMFATKAFTHF
jgi:hypothetical protein